MSVLKSKRHPSSVQYITTAYNIYTRTINFLSRLSARYSRLVAVNIANLASEVVDYSEKANTFYPSDEMRRETRQKYLLEARASLSALDVHLAMCYEILTLNPAGCFSNERLSGKQAVEKLDKIAQELGELIDEESALLTGVLKSGKKN